MRPRVKLTIWFSRKQPRPSPPSLDRPSTRKAHEPPSPSGDGERHTEPQMVRQRCIVERQLERPMWCIWLSFRRPDRPPLTDDGISFAFAFFNITVTNELAYLDTRSLSLLFGSVVVINVSMTPARISLSGRFNPRSNSGMS